MLQILHTCYDLDVGYGRDDRISLCRRRYVDVYKRQANVEWQVTGTDLVGEALMPSQYQAVATYSAKASYQAATGLSLIHIFAGAERLALQVALDALEEFFGNLECHGSAFFSHLNLSLIHIFDAVLIDDILFQLHQKRFICAPICLIIGAFPGKLLIGIVLSLIHI